LFRIVWSLFKNPCLSEIGFLLIWLRFFLIWRVFFLTIEAGKKARFFLLLAQTSA